MDLFAVSLLYIGGLIALASLGVYIVERNERAEELLCKVAEKLGLPLDNEIE